MRVCIRMKRARILTIKIGLETKKRSNSSQNRFSRVELLGVMGNI